MLHDIRWTSQKIAQRLRLAESLIYRRRQPLRPFKLLELSGAEKAPPVAKEVDDAVWVTVEPNSYWLGADTDFVLRTQITVSQTWSDGQEIVLFLPIGEAGDFSHPEALAYLDGLPFAACDRHHQEILLPPRYCDGQEHTLALHGWTGGTHLLRWDGADSGQDRRLAERLLMGECALVQIDRPTRDFVAMARVALGTADQLSADDPVRANLLNALNDAFNVLDTREPLGQRFYDSVPGAHDMLLKGVAASGVPLDVDITAVGHAHIDVAWLWTLAQTRQKAGRTFHNVIRLLEQFPDFHFVQSQPQLYDYVREDYPELFQAIRQWINRGRWEPIGGMWVEADCNLSGPESLARQFLLGRQFFREHFAEGAESAVLWLPDVFGYAWNLPQLIKEAGLEYFFTIKIGWSQYNRFPYDSFWWQGLDGTRVLTHFSPTKDRASAFASTYNAMATPSEVLGTWTNFQQKDWGEPGKIPPLLMSYGHGDGGGGPTRQMLENIAELSSFPGMPRVQPGKVIDFYRRLEESAADRLPTWNGELYLEYHRGTYTTQARNKRANRKSEFLLHDVEFLATMAGVFEPAYQYPYEKLRRAWRLLCLNQFHDIIPGSSIGEVYEDSLQQYAELSYLGQSVRESALAAIGRRIGSDILVVNPTSFARHDPVLLSNELVTDAPAPQSAQAVSEGFLLDIGELPPYSVTPLSAPFVSHEVLEPASASPTFLQNAFLRVELDANGDICRIFDKRNGRDVLPAAEIGNQFQAFEDRPKTPDAWEIDIYYDDRIWYAEPAASIRVLENGPLRAALEIERRIFNSRIVQRISLMHNSARLDFDTIVNWHERHVLLKVAFPVDILSPVATYEIQWGNVERPTHHNTSWDWARFETCAQKWVDLSEGNYGVSLLNDCKYGHDIRDNVMRLTLLRGSTNPDPQADLGDHRFVYSLLPHSGGWNEHTISAAYALNDPLLVAANREPHSLTELAKPSQLQSFLAVDAPNVVIETVKQAEDGAGIIVRLYESQRKRGAFTLRTAFPMTAAWRTNLLEENQEELDVEGGSLHTDIRPYQIVTLRLLPAAEQPPLS